MRRRDDLAVHNERVKLIATISNAVGLAFFGLGFARPIVDDAAAYTAMGTFSLIVGVVGVGCAYPTLGNLKTDEPETDEKAKR